MKVIQTSAIIVLSSLLVLSSFGAFAFASTSNSVKLPISGMVIDNAGNVYSITVSGTAAHYTISGELVSSPYLGYLPWSVTGAGIGLKFTWYAVDPNPSDPSYCSFVYQGTITPSSHSAAGTWTDEGCGTPRPTGTFTLAVCTPSTCSTTTTTDGAVISNSATARPGIAIQ